MKNGAPSSASAGRDRICILELKKRLSFIKYKGKMDSSYYTGASMILEQIITDPDPYEPFLLSQGTRWNNLIFISGQAGYKDDGGIIQGGFRAQGEQAFSNLARVLKAGGSDLKNIVKVTIFLTDMKNFEEVVELRRKYFSKPYPADSIVEVSSLYTPEAMIEIEAIAVATKN
jgi:2-iminobutanoate/2-iminopropanoate deaminase